MNTKSIRLPAVHKRQNLLPIKLTISIQPIGNMAQEKPNSYNFYSIDQVIMGCAGLIID